MSVLRVEMLVMTDSPKQVITLDDLRARRDEILRLAEQHGASNVRIFGSVARGEARPDSDVDILVTMREDASMFDLVGLWLALKDLLGCEVSLIEDEIEPRQERFMRNVLRDAVPL
jgi:predicted nucleotidyltransferase